MELKKPEKKRVEKTVKLIQKAEALLTVIVEQDGYCASADERNARTRLMTAAAQLQLAVNNAKSRIPKRYQ